MIIEYYPIIEPISDKDWRIKDYKKRIFEKFNKNKFFKGDYDFYTMSEIFKIIKRVKKCHGFKNEMDVLFYINKLLTRRKMERYQNARQTKQELQCR